ncbi:MAG: hypothetical protein B6U72_03175 [Candidatus Altiarchaeales archaeon ex4484_2]|nr:MAG: hypothetical protein B6U72_03175 [Candidatus Altiarchaeales archaeon ex4484_2]
MLKQRIKPAVNMIDGIVIPEIEHTRLGRWERQSIPLQVSEDYKEVINEFKNHFKKEITEIGDDTLQQAIEILDKLSG